MKKTVLSIIGLALFSIVDANAQVNLQGGQSGNLGMLTFSRKDDFSKANISGSMYINEKYSTARVNGGTQTFMIRFNPYNNTMEYNNDNQEVVLTKDKNTLVEFLNGATYKLLTYKDKNSRSKEDYMKSIYDTPEVGFYKLEKVDLIPAKVPTNSYDQAAPAEYRRAKDEYFMKLGENTFVAPTKSKDIIKLFPGKEKELKEYFKSNKVNFMDDADLIKLGRYITSIL